MGDAIAGIVANPLSGRDIRRLVTQASVFPTAEKANMIQRMLTALTWPSSAGRPANCTAPRPAATPALCDGCGRSRRRPRCRPPS